MGLDGPPQTLNVDKKTYFNTMFFPRCVRFGGTKNHDDLKLSKSLYHFENVLFTVLNIQIFEIVKDMALIVTVGQDIFADMICSRILTKLRKYYVGK